MPHGRRPPRPGLDQRRPTLGCATACRSRRRRREPRPLMVRVRRPGRRPGCDCGGGAERIQLQKSSLGLFDADNLDMKRPSTTRSCTCPLADDVHGAQHPKIYLSVDHWYSVWFVSYCQSTWRCLIRREASPRPPHGPPGPTTCTDEMRARLSCVLSLDQCPYSKFRFIRTRTIRTQASLGHFAKNAV